METYPLDYQVSRTGSVSKMSEKWLQVISFDVKIEMFSEEMKTIFMTGYLLIAWIEGIQGKPSLSACFRNRE